MLYQVGGTVWEPLMNYFLNELYLFKDYNSGVLVMNTV